jgi:uncharacterized protein YcnI
MSKNLARGGALAAAAGLFALLGAGVASAHVSAHSPDNPAKGGDAAIVFRVPNEQNTAHTTKVQVNFSLTSPLSNADIEPIPGWTARETMITLPTGVKMADDTVTEAVGSIVWTASPGGGIAPGQFQQFTIAVEGLPDNTGTLVMPTVQTYDNGDVVEWNQSTVEGQPEPEHPAPSLTLATDTAAATGGDSDGTARWLGGTGVLVAAVALGFSLRAFARRRRPATRDASEPGTREEVSV